MNSWTFSIVPVFVRFALWLLSFTPSERVALGGAFLVFLGVLGEEVAEIKYLDEKNREGLKKNIKRWSIGILLVGLGFDAVGIVMSQAEMAALINEAGTASTSADKAQLDAKKAKEDAQGAQRLAKSASDIAGPAETTADGAKREADNLGEDARKLSAQLEGEKAALNDLAVCNAPRLIGFRYANGKLSTAPLLPYKGTEATIEFMPDAESRRAAMNIYGAIGGAEWKPNRPKAVDGLSDGVLIVWYTPGPPTAPPPSPSILNRPFAEEARAAAEGLKEFLHSEYWQAESRDRFSNEPDVPIGGVKILVGLYPARALVTPPAEAAAPIPKLPEEMDKQPCRPLSDLVANP